MKKGSDWNVTHSIIAKDKNIRRLRDRILVNLQTYYPLSTIIKGHGNLWVADKIIHYILNYYKIERK